MENVLDDNTRTLMLLQAAIRNIRAAEELHPIDNRLSRAKDLLEQSHEELKKYSMNRTKMNNEEE